MSDKGNLPYDSQDPDQAWWEEDLIAKIAAQRPKQTEEDDPEPLECIVPADMARTLSCHYECAQCASISRVRRPVGEQITFDAPSGNGEEGGRISDQDKHLGKHAEGSLLTKELRPLNFTPQDMVHPKERGQEMATQGLKRISNDKTQEPNKLTPSLFKCTINKRSFPTEWKDNPSMNWKGNKGPLCESPNPNEIQTLGQSPLSPGIDSGICAAEAWVREVDDGSKRSPLADQHEARTSARTLPAHDRGRKQGSLRYPEASKQPIERQRSFLWQLLGDYRPKPKESSQDLIGRQTRVITQVYARGQRRTFLQEKSTMENLPGDYGPSHMYDQLLRQPSEAKQADQLQSQGAEPPTRVKTGPR